MIIITGKVIKGQQYGRVLGFPTANLDRRQFSRKRMKMRLGIYAGFATVPSRPSRVHPRRVEGSVKNRFLDFARDGKTYKAAIVIGPLDKHGLPKIEAHLLNFKGNLYGKALQLILQKYIRPFRSFKTEEDLKKQILLDISKVKKYV